MEATCTKMGTNIREILKTERSKEQATTFTPTETFIKAIGRLARNMVRVYFILRMGENLKANFRTTKNKEKDFL